jgi:hypothetical protein
MHLVTQQQKKKGVNNNNKWMWIDKDNTAKYHLLEIRTNTKIFDMNEKEYPKKNK